MRSYFITFRSVTFAQRGESVLRRSGIGCSLRRTPKKLEEQGCGYSIHLHNENIALALERLRQNQVNFRKVYYQLPGGEMEELML